MATSAVNPPGSGGSGGSGGGTGDGSGVIKFDENTFLGLESGGVAVITVERSHGEAGSASIDYATSNGTASDASDYVATSGTITWGPWIRRHPRPDPHTSRLR